MDHTMLPTHVLHGISLAFTLSTAPVHPIDHLSFCWDRHEIKAHFEDRGLDAIKLQRVSEDDFKVTGYTDTRRYVFLVDACTHDVRRLQSTAIN
jgi:hypothetical protein